MYVYLDNKNIVDGQLENNVCIYLNEQTTTNIYQSIYCQSIYLSINYCTYIYLYIEWKKKL